MNDGVSPTLFARVLQLDDTARAELLAWIGDDPVDERTLTLQLDRMDSSKRRAAAKQ